MAKITASQRQNLIATHQTTIQKDWAAASSTINRLTLELKEFAAWKNDNFLNADSDFDLDDMNTLNAQFTTIYLELKSNIDSLLEIGGLPSTDLAVYKSNNDQFIADNGIDVIEYDKRYKV